MKKVGIVLVNYNNYELTADCIASIKKSTYTAVTIVVVDNASTDCSGKKLSKEKEIVFIQAQENLGFSGGNNLGICYLKKKGVDYIMLLNNDTVIAPDMVEQLMKRASQDIVVVPKMYYFDTSDREHVLWYAGGYRKENRAEAVHIGLGEVDNGQYNQVKNVTFCTGCCWMMHCSVIERVGFLDEKYFMYCEDLDYSIRLQRANVTMKYIPKAKLWHKVSASSDGEMSRFICYYIIRNRLYCAKKNYGARVVCEILLETAYRYVKVIFGKYYKNYIVAPRAVLDYFFGKMGRRI